MKAIFENVIRSGNYKLSDMQHKIKQAYIENDISEDDKTALLNMAAGSANVNGERLNDDARFAALAARIEKLENEVFKSPAEDDAVEAWKPWDGISNKYQPGAVVSHNGKVWESVHTAQNVWEPGAPGTENMWKEKATPDA